MTDYRRIVSYLYKYERGKKGSNVGYVRVEVRKGILKLSIHAQDQRALKDKDFTVYFYYYKESKLKGIAGGTMRFQRGEGEFRTETKESRIFDSALSLEEVNGVLLYYNKELAYGTQWDDQPIQIENFQAEVEEVPKEQKEEIEEPIEEKEVETVEEEEPQREQEQAEREIIEQEAVEQEAIEQEIDRTQFYIDQETLQGLQAIYQEEREEQKEEPIRFQSVAESQQLLDQLLNTQPRINQSTNRDILIMTRIHPQDIGRLSISNWHFGSNSFLIHGFYQFHYVVAGKLLNQDGTVRGVLGVPGIYNNEERYMANQFGFREFVSIKPVQTKTGSFGYWVVDVV